MDTCRIASVHFAPLTPQTRPFCNNPYTLPACPLGAEPAILEIEGVIQRDWGSILPGTSKRQEHRWSVLADEIARDLVGWWSGVTTVGRGMNMESHPGVWVVRDRVPVTQGGTAGASHDDLVRDAQGQIRFRPATPEEFKTMWAEDAAENRRADQKYAEWCWSDGNKISNGDKNNQLIPPNYRLAAKHYGLDASWLREAAAMDSQTCPSCGKLVSKHTFVCAYCQQPTDLVKWATWQAAKDAALRDAKAGKLPSPAPINHQLAA